MYTKNSVVIATALGNFPEKVSEAVSRQGSPSMWEEEWQFFDSAREAREWASARGIDIDGRRFVIAPRQPMQARIGF